MFVDFINNNTNYVFWRLARAILRLPQKSIFQKIQVIVVFEISGENPFLISGKW